MIRLNELEKSAQSSAEIFAAAGKRLWELTAKHPYRTLGIIGGIGATGVALNVANKLRGMHQIVNEASKRRAIDYQTQLLREIAQNSKEKKQEISGGFKQPIPIVPPLR